MDAVYLVVITILFLSFNTTIRSYCLFGKNPIYLYVSLALMCSPVSAEIYKWTDEHGLVHYGDRPVQGSKILDMNSSGIPTPVSATVTAIVSSIEITPIFRLPPSGIA